MNILLLFEGLCLLHSSVFSCACLPWSTSSCTRWTDQLDFRWVLRKEDQPSNQSDVIYRFYATVDEIQRFQLNNTAFIATMNSTINPIMHQRQVEPENFFVTLYNALWNVYPLRPEPSLTLSYSEKPTFLSLFGTGKKSQKNMPRAHEYGTTLIYEPHAPACNHGPALVSMLVFNVTLKDGSFHYATNNTAPVGVGFHPTCTKKDICKMDASLHCIGAEGQRNCAVCLDPENPTDIIGKDIAIFNTYYGTDAKGHRLMSGSSNPLNFRQLAMDAIYNKIATDIGILGETLKSLNPFGNVDSWDELGKNVPNNAFDGTRTR